MIPDLQTNRPTVLQTAISRSSTRPGLGVHSLANSFVGCWLACICLFVYCATPGQLRAPVAACIVNHYPQLNPLSSHSPLTSHLTPFLTPFLTSQLFDIPLLSVFSYLVVFLTACVASRHTSCPLTQPLSSICFPQLSAVPFLTRQSPDLVNDTL